MCEVGMNINMKSGDEVESSSSEDVLQAADK